MKKVDVHTQTPYSVYIGHGLLEECGKIARDHAGCSRAMLVADEQVYALYGQQAKDSLENAGFAVEVFTFPAGEKYKNPETLIRLWEALAAARITRSDLVAALGGGVTGDLAGFAAATYLRGIRYIQIPTTLLAAVDSSVGGKTAIDLVAGKNLAGAFWQPSVVVCDCDTFQTLEDEDFASGMAESLKYGMIADEELFDLVAATRPGDCLEDMVERCVGIKAEIVAGDERDSGQRQLLNLGHTYGHAVERCSGYSVPHGHAVAIGMLAMTRLAEEIGVCQEGCSQRLEYALQGLSLPTRCSYSPEELSDAALGDKKRQGDSITLVLPQNIGSCVLYPVEARTLPELLKKAKGEG